MKKFVLIICSFAFSCSLLFAQTIKTKEVPKEVLTQFKEKNPDAKSVTWQKEKEEYIAFFKDEKSNAKSYFTASGEWLKTMFVVEKEDLPTSIINYVKKTYPKYTDLDEMYFIKQKGEKDYYLVNVLLQEEKLIVTVKFNVTGRYVSDVKKEMPASLLKEAANSKNKDKSDETNTKNDKEKSDKKAKNATPVEPDLVAEDKLPPAVAKTFKKRFMSASDMKWYLKSEDTVYRVTCIVKESNTEGYITKSGIWVNTITEIDPKSLVSAIIKAIDEFYSNYEIKAAWTEVRADKQDQIIVDFIEEANHKSGKITKMYLDKKGAIIKIVDVENKEAEKQETVKQEDDQKEKRDDERIEKEFKKDQKMQYNASKIDESELPSGVGIWIAKEYPEYVVKNAEYSEFPDFPNYGNIYKVLIQIPGVNQPFAIGYFTHDGKLLKVIDDFKKNEDPERQKAIKEAKNEIKRDVTKAIVKAFKEQYSAAEDVRWKEGQNNTWIAEFVEKEFSKEAIYKESGTWIQTITIINQENKIPASIRSYISKKHAGKEIQSCVMVQKPEEKPYYTINLYDKKTKTTSDYDFSSTGQPME